MESGSIHKRQLLRSRNFLRKYMRVSCMNPNTQLHKMKGSAMLSTWLFLFLSPLWPLQHTSCYSEVYHKKYKVPSTPVLHYFFLFGQWNYLKMQRSVGQAIEEVPDHTALKSASWTWMSYSTSPQLQQLSV